MSFSNPATHGEQRLKYACEECHSRKIRCFAFQNTQSGTCTPCHVNGRKCLFALKNKTGRHRRIAQQQSKSQPNETATQEWEQASMNWDHRPNAPRRQSDNTESAYSNAGRFTYLDEPLSSLTGRPPSFSPQISGPSMDIYGSTARAGDLQHDSPRMLDYEVDYTPDTELPPSFHTGSLSNTSSESSSDIMSQDFFGVSLMSAAPDSAPLVVTALSTELSSAGSNSQIDLAGDSAYKQAFSTSQQIHRRLLQTQSQAFDSTNKYSSAEVCQTLDSFDVLAKLLKQRIANHQHHPHSGGLPAMIISGVLYVAVLQAILIATVLLQSDDGESSSEQSPDNSQSSNSMLQYDRRPSATEDQAMSGDLSAPQSISNLDCILNLTKMEYYITVFNQYLQLFFSVNNADRKTQGSSPVFDYRACIDTTESVQSRVRLLLSHSRQSML